MDTSYYTTKQIADLFDVTIRAVQLWADKGVIDVVRTEGGHRRIAESEIEKIHHYLGVKAPLIHQNGVVNKADNRLYILLVEDDEYMLSLYEEAIKSWEAPAAIVVKASNGYQALIEVGKQDFDLIVADIMMPNIDGAKMIEMIRRNYQKKSPAIAIVTSLSNDQLRQQYSIPDDITIFEKPVSFAQLQRLASSLNRN